jgi:hypothetical protein
VGWGGDVNNHRGDCIPGGGIGGGSLRADMWSSVSQRGRGGSGVDS